MIRVLDNRGRMWAPPVKGPKPATRIPDDCDPAVRFILSEIGGSARASRDVEARAGLGLDTIRMWIYRAHHHGPYLPVVRAALNAMGYDLAIVRLGAAERCDRPLDLEVAA